MNTLLSLYWTFMYCVALDTILDIERAWYDWRDYKAYVARCLE